MIAVIQRVSKSSVKINGEIKSEIGQGLNVLLGIEGADEFEDIQWLSRKIANMRIFDDEEGVMNKSLLDIKGEALVISQFTLHASTKKGNRPSYIKAAKPDYAVPLYEKFVEQFELEIGKPVATGEFGADMKVEIQNDGPVTIIVDTKDKK
ncbi:D-tyrosyl-tRNA(Tyr) deacylase [Fulvivirga sp. RKSG066]|uniref:D-aminoacyl-tRNA deacylase n=1 Tax=Fulvivirga aurantia TaxID=2529383 RepID=UPI0012BD6B26|nr:D-aminoacyl-tRNA deacylase [Fulvivirga aurantia]MTI21094.1 D-tyrosyl-tRNA(Tyr) deacylase [Fulvivirga aurantia]